MAAIDPQTLLEEAKCYACFAQTSLPEMLKLALLSRIAVNGAGGGGGSQTPWTSDINGGGFDLSNVDNIAATTFNGALTGNVTGNLTGNVTGNLTGNVTGASSLNVLKAGDTMTGLLTIAQATANTSALAVTGYSLTGANAQSLMSLAGTWNTSGTPTAIDLNITDTASNALSILMSLRRSGTSVMSVSKFGTVTAGGFTTSGSVVLNANTSSIFIGSSLDVSIVRDAADVLAQQRTTNAQTFRWYRTFTNSSNYERGALQTAAGQVIVAAETAGTGTDDIDVSLVPAGVGRVTLPGGAQLLKTTAAMTSGAGASAGTLGNAPSIGNPAVWCPIMFNGVQHWFPCWT